MFLIFGLPALYWRCAIAPIAACILSLTSASAWGQALQAFHIDVNQGDATLIVAPSGRTLLIDSGGNGRGRQIIELMRDEGIDRIDHYVTTHYHGDHYGGIDELVAAGIPVIQAYDRGNKDAESGTRFDEYQAAVGEDAIALTPGTLILLDDNMTVTTISSSGAIHGDRKKLSTSDENELSVSLLIEYGEFSMFVGGDIHAATEKKIAAVGNVHDVDVYQANHHGSHTSSDPAFLSVLRPRVVVISNGDHGGFHHPRQVTLDNLQNLDPPPTIFQTNKLIKIGSTGGNTLDAFIADLDPSGFEGTITIDVDLAADSFTISYRDGATSIGFPLGPPGSIETVNASTVVIKSLMPNPVGSDRKLETVTLRNDTSDRVTLDGWRLQDEAGLTWQLDASHSIAPGAQLALLRNGQKMSLNNGSDVISLIDNTDAQRDQFAYDGSSEGVVIETDH